ncbi:hypothetical protein KM043_009107 [Ampulex compressa]|nr:hypothetical protein KM043_009107 [Ampulex compressa]
MSSPLSSTSIKFPAKLEQVSWRRSSREKDLIEFLQFSLVASRKEDDRRRKIRLALKYRASSTEARLNPDNQCIREIQTSVVYSTSTSSDLSPTYSRHGFILVLESRYTNSAQSSTKFPQHQPPRRRSSHRGPLVSGARRQEGRS